MTTDTRAHPAPPTAAAEAAVLLTAASVHPAAPAGQQLHCLAALTALDIPTAPATPRQLAQPPDALIRHALHSLAGLPAEQFTDPAIRAAARHARHALLAG